MITKKYLDDLTYEIIGGAIEVHKTLGRGLLESVYQRCLKEELLHGKINFLTEMHVPITYKGKTLNADFRCDLFVEQCIVVEKCPKGILINFNCSNIFREGQKTFINEYFSTLPD